MKLKMFNTCQFCGIKLQLIKDRFVYTVTYQA